MKFDWRVFAVGLAAIIAFVVAFWASGLVRRARAAASAAKNALAAIADAKLADEEKERVVRGASLHMFGQFVMITLTAAAVLAAPVLVMWICDLSGIAPFASVSDFLLSWEVLIGATALFLAIAWLVKRA